MNRSIIWEDLQGYRVMVVDVWCKYAKHRRCIYTRLHFQLFTNLQTHMTAACSPWFVFPVRVTQEARHRKRDSWRDQAARDEPAAVTVAEATKGASINGAGGANGELSTQSSPPDRLISSAARTIPVGLPMAAPALPGGLRPMNQLYTAPYHYVVNARGERVRVDGPRYPTATMTTAASALATRASPAASPTTSSGRTLPGLAAGSLALSPAPAYPVQAQTSPPRRS